MFTPVKTRPPARIAAPTWNSLYGAYALVRTSAAAATSSSICFSGGLLSGCLRWPRLLGILGLARDQHLGDATPVHLLRLEHQILVGDLLALLGDGAEQAQHQPAHRIPLLVGELGVEELVHLIDPQPPVDAVGPVPKIDDRRLLPVVLVGDLPHELLEEVLQRHQAGD